MSDTKIQALEQQIFELSMKLVALHKSGSNIEVPNYTFQTQGGDVTLRDLFGDKDKLLVIHNMGQACRYCTLWADGFNGFVPHLESAMSLVLASKDEPATQRRFASSRGWRFRLVSHGGGIYMEEQSVVKDQGNMPGAVVYERVGDKIMRQNSCVFGPGDLYCSMWGLLGLARLGTEDRTPQYSYWKRPVKLDEGGENVLE